MCQQAVKIGVKCNDNAIFRLRVFNDFGILGGAVADLPNVQRVDAALTQHGRSRSW